MSVTIYVAVPVAAPVRGQVNVSPSMLVSLTVIYPLVVEALAPAT